MVSQEGQGVGSPSLLLVGMVWVPERGNESHCCSLLTVTPSEVSCTPETYCQEVVKISSLDGLDLADDIEGGRPLQLT